MKYQPVLNVGACVIRLDNPTPDQICMSEIWERLTHTQRFSSDPQAFNVMQHTRLVMKLVENDPLGIIDDDLLVPCLEWARYHDTPEAVIGDLPGPMKQYMRACGDTTFDEVEEALMHAILVANDVDVNTITPMVKKLVHIYDKVAQDGEWLYHMNRGEPHFKLTPYTQQISAIALQNAVVSIAEQPKDTPA